jgi:hypothetical protein
MPMRAKNTGTNRAISGSSVCAAPFATLHLT